MKKEIQELLNNIEKYKQVDKVNIVAVTKTRSIEEIQSLLTEYPFVNLGENKPQELRDKYDSNTINDVSWHMIGRLQSNKIKYLIDRASLIHSIASFDILEEINKQASKKDKIIEVLLQINPSLEESKQGFNKEELLTVIDETKEFNNIRIVGLMCMAPFTDDESIINEVFAKAKQIYDEVRTENFKYLSMGMSNDYIIALKNGSNMIRVGSLLFS